MSEQAKEEAQGTTAVLCVDPNADANATVGYIIEEDAELWTAGTFRAALEAIKRRPFQLVICDVTSAEVRGMDVLSILSTLYPSTPVIVTSEPGVAGWTGDAFNELGEYAGQMKPYDSKLLKAAINGALWRTPVMGKGEVGRAVLLTAAIHETAEDELAALSDEERGEVRTVVEVLERISPFVK